MRWALGIRNGEVSLTVREPARRMCPVSVLPNASFQSPTEEITVTLVKIIVITVLIILSILFLGRFFI